MARTVARAARPRCPFIEDIPVPIVIAPTPYAAFKVSGGGYYVANGNGYIAA